MDNDVTMTPSPNCSSRWSLWSENSVLSIGSKGSVLSIGSVGSAPVDRLHRVGGVRPVRGLSRLSGLCFVIVIGVVLDVPPGPTSRDVGPLNALPAARGEVTC